jgi:hypothetical protein
VSDETSRGDVAARVRADGGNFACRSAAVATLPTHQYNYPMNEQAAFRAMYESGDQARIRTEGLSLLDVKRVLEERPTAGGAVSGTVAWPTGYSPLSCISILS